MINNDNLSNEEEEDFLLFSDDEENGLDEGILSKSFKENWKILIVDDEEEIHTVSMMVLKDFEYNNKGLTFINAYSAEEAIQLIKVHDDTVLILLDVVMEDDEAGLRVVSFIRNELKNHFVRIILRTGQPGRAPEKKIILDYDINDYKEKTELTSEKLFTSVISSIRSYEQINIIENQKSVLKEWNLQLEKMVLDRTASIRTLLDNAGQGFLSFGKDLQINLEYSSECDRIFGRKLAGHTFSELIHPNDPTMQDEVNMLLQSIFQEEDLFVREMWLNLLPTNIELNNKFIKVTYKILKNIELDEETCMIILDDLTEQVELESALENERKILKMIVNAVTHQGDFFDVKKEYLHFCNVEIEELLNKGTYSVEDTFVIIYRKIHTFKGNFQQLDMVHIVYALHEIETKLSNLRKNSRALDQKVIKEIIKREDLLRAIDEDVKIIEKILGATFLQNEDVVTIPYQRLIDLEELITKTFPSKISESFIEELRKIRFRPFKELLNGYGTMVERIGSGLGKRVEMKIIEHQEILVDLQKYSSFKKVLPHLLRNMVDHGLETIEEREGVGKQVIGKIEIHIMKMEQSVVLTIEDDGRGINMDAIRAKLVAKGLYQEKEIESMTEEELLDKIFLDDFSTKDMINEISGRGMGLSALKAEIDAWNGSIEVVTQTGKGTKFIILLPMS